MKGRCIYCRVFSVIGRQRMKTNQVSPFFIFIFLRRRTRGRCYLVIREHSGKKIIGLFLLVCRYWRVSTEEKWCESFFSPLLLDWRGEWCGSGNDGRQMNVVDFIVVVAAVAAIDYYCYSSEPESVLDLRTDHSSSILLPYSLLPLLLLLLLMVLLLLLLSYFRFLSQMLCPHYVTVMLLLYSLSLCLYVYSSCCCFVFYFCCSCCCCCS